MSFLGNEEQVRELQERFRLLYFVLFIGLGLLSSRMIYLQILRGDLMRRYSEDNRIKRVKIPAPRGMFFDRNRVLLMDNRPAFDLEIIPQYLKESGQRKEVLDMLSRLVNMKVEEIEEKLEKLKAQPSFMPVKIKTDLNRDEVARIESWRIAMPGVSVEMEIERTNVFGDVASHFLGYIGAVTTSELPVLNKKEKRYEMGDNIGKIGIEKQLEDELRGIDGQDVVEVDALGRRIRNSDAGRVLDEETPKRPVTPGKNMVLTIDQDVQLAAVKAFGEKVGALVAINPKNGEIIAMISRPSFDPTEFSRGISPTRWKQLIDDENHPLRDKTIQDHYPPGSTFKAITAIAGLEEGVIDEKTTFGCSGSLKVGNRVIHCHKKGGHGNVDVVKALEQSCDVFFYKLTQKLKSIDDVSKWAFALGLGQKTGIDLPRETSGLVPTEEWKMRRFGEPWNQGESMYVAIGQGFLLTTVVQLANAYAGIANGGPIYKPHYIKSVESYEGDIIQDIKPEIIHQAKISEKTIALVKQGLSNVINGAHGTATFLNLPGMEFGGKTGTAQLFKISSDKIYNKCENMKYNQRHHGVFVGMAPMSDPKIVVAVLGEHVCHGNTGAGPIARDVIKTYLEKTFPEEYAPKVIAEKIKANKIAVPVRASKRTADESEDVFISQPGVIPPADLPKSEDE
ncbi:MAG: penicillin-binding protein 2 [Xanthomonadaceae bacterium]|nr:penicillin-binding protein 2 [Xanthomonadaceae bacterium]